MTIYGGNTQTIFQGGASGSRFGYQPKSDGGYDYFMDGQPVDENTYLASGGKVFSEVPKADGGYDYSINGQATSLADYQTAGGQPSGGYDTAKDAPAGSGIAVQNTQPTVPTGASTPDPMAGYNATDENAFNQDQIDAINRLIGTTNVKGSTGLTNIDNNYNSQNTDLATNKNNMVKGYQIQTDQNAQDKQTGIDQVDTFANNSYNSLMRLLSGAGAGNSSVARTVVPTLVSKSAGTRRQGVFDTAGTNEANIVNAKDTADSQFGLEQKRLDKWKTDETNTLNSGILDQLNKLTAQRRGYEITKDQLGNPTYAANAVATGNVHPGYLAAKSAGANSQAEIDARMAELDKMFGTPSTFTPNAINITTPDYKKYQIDPATINANNQPSTPGYSGYYGQLLKKKKDLTLA